MSANPSTPHTCSPFGVGDCYACDRIPVESLAAPTIAERRNPRTGREEFRAYPHGRDSLDGGAGPWTPDREAAAANLAAALAVEALADAAALAVELAGAKGSEVADVRDEATTELWRTRKDPDDSPRRATALARHAIAQAELSRRTKNVTGYNSIGQTATLSFQPGGRGGSAWVMLDKDPGIGSMSYPDFIESWTLTGGDPGTLSEIATWAQERAAFRARNGFPEDTPGAQHSRAWLFEVAALAAERAEEATTGPIHPADA